MSNEPVKFENFNIGFYVCDIDGDDVANLHILFNEGIELSEEKNIEEKFDMITHEYSKPPKDYASNFEDWEDSFEKKEVMEITYFDDGKMASFDNASDSAEAMDIAEDVQEAQAVQEEAQEEEESADDTDDEKQQAVEPPQKKRKVTVGSKTQITHIVAAHRVRRGYLYKVRYSDGEESWINKNKQNKEFKTAVEKYIKIFKSHHPNGFLVSSDDEKYGLFLGHDKKKKDCKCVAPEDHVMTFQDIDDQAVVNGIK